MKNIPIYVDDQYTYIYVDDIMVYRYYYIRSKVNCIYKCRCKGF